ncbi:MAG: VanW family protein, partial [Lachnospiraceae bacterium]|nr:VanW family protein [Lachnospiraceae bacterium]
ENGYHMAGSYLNGQVVDSLGGGICQVSTTLYNAVLLSELEVTERHNHSMIVTYVDPSADAAISESAGKDFRFVNNLETPIYIEGYTTDDKQIVFTVYGEETRQAGHRVEYESEIISKTYPDSEMIYTDGALPVGSVSVQSAHIGYKANLWKVVYENEQEVSREMVNSSVYKMVPRTATVGVATEDPNALNAIMAAVATNNIDYVKGVAAALAAGTEVPAPPAPPAPPAEAVAPSAEQPAQPAPEVSL